MTEKLQILLDELILLFDEKKNGLQIKPLQLWDQVLKEARLQQKKYGESFAGIMNECKKEIYIETFSAWEMTGYNKLFLILKKKLIKLANATEVFFNRKGTKS